MSLSTPVRAVLVSTILFFLTSFAMAQYGASIEGTVTDKSGAVIGGATVTVTVVATNVSHSAATSPRGFYRSTGLPPAHYKVEAEAGSFRKSPTTVELSAETASAFNVELQPKSATETV